MDSNIDIPNERIKYIEGLQKKLQKAGKARRFMEGEDGAIITKFLTEQINAIVKNIGGKTYLNDINSTNYDRGQLAMAQKLLTILNSEANRNTSKINEQLQAAKNDG